MIYWQTCSNTFFAPCLLSKWGQFTLTNAHTPSLSLSLTHTHTHTHTSFITVFSSVCCSIILSWVYECNYFILHSALNLWQSVVAVVKLMEKIRQSKVTNFKIIHQNFDCIFWRWIWWFLVMVVSSIKIFIFRNYFKF